MRDGVRAEWDGERERAVELREGRGYDIKG